MCLAIPGRLIEITETEGLKMGRIDYSGTIHTACLEYLPDVQPGQYVLVHAGFAISAIDEEEAQKTLELWRQLAEEHAREGLDPFGMPLSDDAASDPSDKDR